MHFTDDKPLHGETAIRAEELLQELAPEISTNDKIDMLVSYLGVSPKQARRFVDGRDGKLFGRERDTPVDEVD